MKKIFVDSNNHLKSVLITALIILPPLLLMFGIDTDSNDIKDELIVKKFFRMNAANGLIDKGSKSLGAIDGFFVHSYTNQLREYYCCNTVTEMVIKEGIVKWID